MASIESTESSKADAPGATGVDTRDARPLHVLVQGLADADIAKLATFMRIGRDHLRCEWKIVFQGEVHVLLFGGDEPATILGMLDSPLNALRVADARGTEPVPTATLLRPLQYEVVIDTLLDVERRIAGHSRKGPPPAAPTAPPPGLAAGDRYRLRRWPPAELVQRSRDHMRIASYLATRHVSLSELAQLTNLGLPPCEYFLTALLAAGVLDIKPAPAPAAAAAAVPAVAAAPALAKTAAREPGLFGRLRRTLGMSWT